MTAPVSIIEFLLARLLDDENAASRCTSAPWVYSWPGHVHVDPVVRRENKQAYGALGHVASVDSTPAGDAYGVHIACHDPARVLRGVQAKRALVDEHRIVDGRCRVCTAIADGHAARFRAPCPTLRLLASEFDTHQDYRPEWSVS